MNNNNNIIMVVLLSMFVENFTCMHVYISKYPYILSDNYW